MSHYAVAVFSDDGDFDSLLKPYNENDREEFVFAVVPYETIQSEFQKFKKQNPSYTLNMYIKLYKYEQNNGQWGYWHNPHGYWDWYSLDGRSYMYDLKDGVELSEDEYDYRKNDYDWYPEDKENTEEDAEFWDVYISGGKEDGYPSLWSREYYLERYKTREQFLKEMALIVPYAFITPDGVWHAPGEVGPFATSSETAESFNKYVKEWEAWIASDENPYVNLVDCHI